ncbi:hypothetical protein UPYG_G00206120 [Umbra pygmaea]|uniref:Uncharacterized protein n=1 Tax=Umbra pygmaea TaxID=75934 RepID=A0ABD0WPD0_UMBPY
MQGARHPKYKTWISAVCSLRNEVLERNWLRLCSKLIQGCDSSVHLVLQGLSVLLGDDPSNFYNTSFDSYSDEAWAQVSVGLLTVISKDAPLSPNYLHLDPVSTAIILEGGIVMDNLQNLAQALYLFGLCYPLHLDYPKAMKNTFNLIQRVMLGLGENKLPPKLQTLKNLLLS